MKQISPLIEHLNLLSLYQSTLADFLNVKIANEQKVGRSMFT